MCALESANQVEVAFRNPLLGVSVRSQLPAAQEATSLSSALRQGQSARLLTRL